MESVAISLTNATMVLVKDMEVYFEQSENTATVEVGVLIGVFSSVLIVLCLCSATVCLDEMKRSVCCKPSVEVAQEDGQDNDMGGEREHDGEDDGEDGGGGDAVGTEGAYRSNSESEGDEENVNVSRQAQKRARRTSGI